LGIGLEEKLSWCQLRSWKKKKVFFLSLLRFLESFELATSFSSATTLCRTTLCQTTLGRM